MEILLGAAVIILVLIIFEYRLRKPDQIILYEKGGLVRNRKARFYPRHFSLAVSGSVHSRTLDIEADAKGRLAVQIRLAAAVAASPNNLSDLIRAGGWNKDAVLNASIEFDIILQALVKEFTEKYEIEELQSEMLSEYLKNKLGKGVESLGLDVLSLTVQAVNLADEEIASAMQQRESARIIEETEVINQHARTTARKAAIEADEEIAKSEHELELKRIALRKEREEKESVLADIRTEDELKRKNMQLDFDRKEIEILKDNPELLILSPQAARLAEASQNLKNARTIVSLSPNDAAQGTELIGLLQTFLQNLIQKKPNRPHEK